MPTNKTFLIGMDNDGYESEPLTSIHGGDGTTSLSTIFGIPKLGQVSSFKSVNSGNVANGTVLYTAPAGKTLYIFNIIYGNVNISTNTGIGIDVTFGGTRYNETVAGASSIQITNIFPVAIVQSGQTVTANSLTGGASLTFTGYEEYGTTT